MIETIATWLIGTGIFVFGLSFLVHICSKNKYSFSYESAKRKFEIYPNNKNKSQKQTTTE